MGPTGEDGVMVAMYRHKWWEFSELDQRRLRVDAYLRMRRDANRLKVLAFVENEVLDGADVLDAYEQALGINGWKEAAIPVRA